MLTTHSNHPFHLVDYSPWPLTGAIGAMVLVSGLAKWFHLFNINLFMIGFGITLLTMIQWWPFECGFDPKSSARMPFSMRFFLIAVIFLIFDVEIALILPIVIIFKTSDIMIWTVSTMFFILVLLGGLYHEWNQGALQWAE